jgi:hypothetical protein
VLGRLGSRSKFSVHYEAGDAAVSNTLDPKEDGQNPRLETAAGENDKQMLKIGRPWAKPGLACHRLLSKAMPKA